MNKKHADNALNVKNFLKGQRPESRNSSFHGGFSYLSKGVEKENSVASTSDCISDANPCRQGKRAALMEIDSLSRKGSFCSMSTMSQFRGYDSVPLENSQFWLNCLQNESLLEPLFSKYNAVIPHEYLRDIWEALMSEEISNTVNYALIMEQKDINENMRAILVDWIVDVHGKFNLKQETLFITVNILDRYLSSKQVLRSKLQLVGVAALMIACKYEEILCPDLRDFVYVTDKTYSKQEIIAAEKEILDTLEFNITVPTPLRFFEIIALNFNFNEIEFAYGKYLLEIFLIDVKMNKYPSSLIALSTAYLIMKINNYSNYQDLYSLFNKDVAIQCYSNSKTLKECAKNLHFLSQHAQEFTKLQAVYTKFCQKEHHRVAQRGMGIFCVRK